VPSGLHSIPLMWLDVLSHRVFFLSEPAPLRQDSCSELICVITVFNFVIQRRTPPFSLPLGIMRRC